MSLVRHDIDFERRLKRFENNFFDYYSNPTLSRSERWFRMEGLLSQTWQSWCHFCRSIIIDSCLGTTATGGRSIPRAQASWVDEERISYEARCAVKNDNPKTGMRLVSRRQEITWGDTDKLVTVITKLSPSNSGELLGGFGGGLSGPKHLQTVRNTAAHINSENITELKRLMAYYFGPTVKHPTDLAIWSEIHTKNPAYICWIADMRLIAATVIV